MESIKTKILNHLLSTSESKKEYLEKVFERHKEFFEQLLVREFVGYIPKTTNEPALKIFEEHAEIFQRWILWQSYYLNRKALHDPLHLPKYDGMMIYLKVLHVMAEANRKKIDVQKPVNVSVERPWLDTVMEDLNAFNKEYADKANKTNIDKTGKNGKAS